MKKLLFILSLFITTISYSQSIPDTVFLKIKSGGGKTDLSNYFTKGQIDSINAGYYTKSQVDSIVATINATVHINGGAGITVTGTGTTGDPFIINADTTTIHIVQLGAGISTLRGSNDTLHSSNIQGSGTVTVTKQPDSSILITGSAGSSGTVTSVAKGYGIVNDGTITTTGTVTTDSASLANYFTRRKDSTVSFVTPYQSSLKQNISDSGTKYVTPTQLSNKATNWFNILKYGASPSNTSAQNTTAINNAIAAALGVKGTVYIPYGAYLVDSLIWNPYVSIVGDGSGSILRSNSAVTLLSYTGLAGNIIAHNNTLSNFVLDGNNVGTVGLYTNFMSEFTLNNVYCINFTQYGAHLYRTLIGSVNNCSFLYCGTGVFLDGTSSMGANLVTFNTCRFSVISKIGLNVNFGSGVIINSADFESCGTKGDSTTGAIYTSMSTAGIAMSINRGWFEGNHGTQINFGAPYAATTYTINDVPITIGDSAQYGLLVANGSTVYVKNSTISGAVTKDIQSKNVDTKVILTNTTVGTTNATLSSMILKNISYNGIALTDSTSGGVWVNLTNKSLNPNADTRILFNNSASGASIYKPSTTWAGYRNASANDFVFYNTGGNYSFVQDNSSGNYTFGIGSNTLLSIFPNGVSAGGGIYNSTLYAGGSFSTMATIKSANYTLTQGDNTIIYNGGSYTVTLVASGANIMGREYSIINNGSGVITLTTGNSQYIGNNTSSTSVTIPAGGSIKVKCNGSVTGSTVAWQIVSQKLVAGIDYVAPKARVYSQTSIATLTINSDTTDLAALTAQAVALTIANPTGTPSDYQRLSIRIKDNGTAQTISFGAAFRFGSNSAAPTTTTISKVMYMDFRWNAISSTWDMMNPFNNF